MNKGPMSHGKTSRRQFVRLAGGLALALRHGLLPARSETDARSSHASATLEDSALRIEWDANLHARVLRRTGEQWVPMTAWGPSEYLAAADGPRSDARHITDFAISHQASSALDDVNGPGTRLTLSGTSAEGIEKTLEVTTYRRHRRRFRTR